ncbi:MAG: hypothetical protein CL581_09445 [Alteromonadaceae bacterium]|jgi:hypothetical protein|nr:hypothetical protein [Alteromonadaceae bacterium]
MNPEDALEQLREQQAEMVRQAQEMEDRAVLLQKLSACFLQGFKWTFQYSIDETEERVGGIRLVCSRSGAWCEHMRGNPKEVAGLIMVTFKEHDYTLQQFFDAHNSKEEEQ